MILKEKWVVQTERPPAARNRRRLGDVEAENVLIDEEVNPWVIDFGRSFTPGWVTPG